MKNESKSAAAVSEQVFFIIGHDVKPDQHDAYESWLKRIVPEAAKFPGHLGANVSRPPKGSHHYEIAVRFARDEDALRWVDSNTRRRLIAEVGEYLTNPEKVAIKSGIDYWFTPATGASRAPWRWKQWLTTVSVIWPLSIVVGTILEPLFRAVPFLGVWGIRQLISAMIVVGMVVYVVMPPYTRAIAKWLSR